VERAAEDGIPWSHATEAVGQPHLRHYLYGIETRELAKLWPGSPFVDSRPMRPLKTLPLALAPYLCADKNERDLQDILNEYYTQKEEITNLQNLVAVVLANKEPNWEAYGPIATAFAATFFRGSRCLRKRRERLLVKILQHPVAAHVALESGVWQAETGRLVEALAADPRLLLDYWKSPLRSEPMEIGLVHAALEAAPHLHSLMPHRNAEITQQDAWTNLVLAADEHKNAMAAAFALGLQPKHGLAEKWIRQMKSNPQALYWAVRVGNWGGRSDAAALLGEISRPCPRRSPLGLPLHARVRLRRGLCLCSPSLAGSLGGGGRRRSQVIDGLAD
jgi:hypothetical protein